MEERHLSTSRRWTFAMGNNGFFIAMTLYTIYPLAFMTAALGMPFPRAVQILTLTRIFDILIGFFLGPIIEKIRMPWGKYRSWFLVGPLVAGVSTCLFFSSLLLYVPNSIVVPLGFILLLIWNVAGSIVLACHNALNTVLIYNPMERLSVFKLSNQLQAITGFIAGFFMMKIVFAVGGEQRINLLGMQIIGIIYSFLFFILYLVFFINLRDYKDDEISGSRKNSLIDTIKLLFTNTKIASLTISGMLGFSAETFFKAIASYYFLYALFSAEVLDVFNWASVLAAFIGASLAMPLARKTSKKNAYITGYFLMGASLVFSYFTADTPYLSLTAICIGFIGLNFPRSVLVPMYSDASDFTLHATGKHIVSHAMALYMMTFKIAGLIAAQASGLLAKVGYVTGKEPLPEISEGIRRVSTLGPAIFAIAGALVMLIFYRLDEKKVPAIQAEIMTRNEKGGTES
jgi:Na+/melibiose symporter-like transporter